MADKRQSTAGKIATPKVPSKEMVEQDYALCKAIGARIKVTAAPNNRVLEGTLFTACPITNTIALNTAPPPPNPSSTLTSQPGDYHIIPVCHIVSFQLLSEAERAEGSPPGFDGVLPSIGKLDLDALKAREEATIRKLKERDALRVKGIGKEAQEIFDALARTLPCRWHDTSIVVNDAVIIASPYRLEDCAAPKDKQHSLNQVKKILDGYFNKKRSTTPQAPVKLAVATPIAPRRGG